MSIGGTSSRAYWVSLKDVPPVEPWRERKTPSHYTWRTASIAGNKVIHSPSRSHFKMYHKLNKAHPVGLLSLRKPILTGGLQLPSQGTRMSSASFTWFDSSQNTLGRSASRESIGTWPPWKQGPRNDALTRTCPLLGLYHCWLFGKDTKCYVS